MKRGGIISRLRPELAENHMKQEGPKLIQSVEGRSRNGKTTKLNILKS